VAASATVGIAVMNLSKILDAIKRVAGFPAELRLQRTQTNTEQLLADVALLEANDHLAEARARHRRRQLEAAGWKFVWIVVTAEDDDVVL
jgi:hypothetical protein